MAREIGQKWKVHAYTSVADKVPQDGEMMCVRHPNDPEVTIPLMGNGIATVAKLYAGRKGDGGPTTTVFSKTFNNQTFDGEVNAVEMKFGETVSAVSFWGYASQIAVGSVGQSFVILDPVSYPLLQRFKGQVDQFAIGYNSGTGDFKYTPLRITAQNGFEAVTAPSISVGTRFSFQFMLILTE